MRASPASRPARADPDWPTAAATAGAAAGGVFGLADFWGRARWGSSPALHVVATLALTVPLGTLVGLTTVSVVRATRWAEQRVERLLGRGSRFTQPALLGLAAALVVWSTARWTFSGPQVSKTVLAFAGPWLFAGGLAVVTMGGTTLARRGLKHAHAGTAAPIRIGIVLALVSAAGLIVIDRTLYVALYGRLHTLLAVSAAVLITLVATFWLTRLLSHHPRLGWALRGLLATELVWVAVLGVSGAARSAVAAGLAHVWDDPIYSGRALRFMHSIEASLTDPLGLRGVTSRSLRIQRLINRFDIVTTRLDPRWRETPSVEPTALAEALQLRAEVDRPNVLIIYVDTLRLDVAEDSHVMPRVAMFAQQALRYRCAYAPGSDTATSLPVILRGIHALESGSAGEMDAERPPGRDLVRVATAAGYEDALIVPRSAREYLAKKVPSFRFSNTVEVADYSGDREVWGYGADQPVAAELVNRAIDFLERPRPRPFLLWIFHYDLHNWSELRTEHLRAVSAEQAITRGGPLPWRYRATAASVDREIGRLLETLAHSSHAENTIVVFLSDHGESLGRGGFLKHSVYLWESLLRVPLLLRIPDIPAAEISTAVSLVDLTPTLALSIDRATAVAGYHGEDLLLRTLDSAPARRLPILFSAAQGGQLVRIGILDPKHPLKLVWHLSAATPTLLSLVGSELDGTDVSSQYPLRTAQMLQSLVQSPVFPRTVDGP